MKSSIVMGGLALAWILGTATGCASPVMCIRAVECVRSCGGPVEASGCIACPAGTFDRFGMCGSDAGDVTTTSDATDASVDRVEPGDATDVPVDLSMPGDVLFDTVSGPIPCGSSMCNDNELCVQPCSGVDSGMPNPPRCVPLPAECVGGDPCACQRAACGNPLQPSPPCLAPVNRQLRCVGCA